MFSMKYNYIPSSNTLDYNELYTNQINLYMLTEACVVLSKYSGISWHTLMDI